jgi:arabinose-5-phosphate isomerase
MTNGAYGAVSSGSISEFFDLALEEMASLRTKAEIDAIERAASLIIEAESQGGRVHVTVHATECIHGSAGQVCSNDITIAISNSGTTPELMRAVEMLRDLGNKIIAVSGDPQSSLARTADVLLYAGVDNEGGMLNLVPRASILAKIFVLCALSVSLEAHKGLTKEQYARWHPAGTLGRLARGG